MNTQMSHTMMYFINVIKIRTSKVRVLNEAPIKANGIRAVSDCIGISGSAGSTLSAFQICFVACGPSSLKGLITALYAHRHAGRPKITNLFMRSRVRRLALIQGLLRLPLEVL